MLTEGGDPVPATFGPNPMASKVFVADLIDPATKKFTEHHALIGFNSREEAMAALMGLTDAAHLGELTQMPREEFSEWVQEGANGDGPLAYGRSFNQDFRAKQRSVAYHDQEIASQVSLNSGIPEGLLNPDTGEVETNDILVSNLQAVDTIFGKQAKAAPSMIDPSRGATVEKFVAAYRPDKGVGAVLSKIANVLSGYDFSKLPKDQAAQFKSIIELGNMLKPLLGDVMIEFANKSGDGRTLGEFDPAIGNAGKITIFLGEHDARKPLSFYATVLHEAVHAVTTNQIYRFDAVANARRLRDLLTKVGLGEMSVESFIQEEEVTPTEGMEKMNRFRTVTPLSAAENEAVLNLYEVYFRALQTTAKMEGVAPAQLVEMAKSQDDYYGFLNVHEFASEAMTNPVFQQMLLVRDITHEGKKVSIWQAFLNSVKKMISALYDTPGDIVSGTQLETALQNVFTIIQGYDPDANAKAFERYRMSEREMHRREEGGREIEFANTTENEVSPDLDSNAIAKVNVAAQNAIRDSLHQIYRTWVNLGHNTAGLTFEQFVQTGNFVKLEAQPQDIIDRINTRLQAASQAPVDPRTRIAQVPAESMQKRGAAVAHRILTQVWTAMSQRRKAAEWNLSHRNSHNLVDALANNNMELHDLLTKYTDIEKVTAVTKKKIAVLLDVMNERANTIGEAGHEAGQLEQVIKDLEGKMDKPLATQYRKALNNLYAKLTGDRDSSRRFGDVLDAVASLKTDWENTSTKEIREAIQQMAPVNPVLSQLTGADATSKALLATVVAFGKSNNHVMGLLELRKSQALNERNVVNAAFQRALEQHERAFEAADDLVKTLPTLGKKAQRILAKLKEAKRTNRDLLDEIHRERTFIDFHQDTAGVLRTEMARLEHRIGAASQDWEIRHMGEYIVPPSPNANILQTEANQKTMLLTANGMLSAEVRADIKRMKDWLAKVPVDQQGALWGTINTQVKKLEFHDLNWMHLGIQGHWINRLIAPITDRLRFIGTPAARAAARRLEQMTFWTASKAKQAHLLGTKWEQAEGAAMKAMGFQNKEAFQQMFHNAAMSFIEKRQDILAKHANVEDAENAVLKEVRAYFNSDPTIGKLIAQPGAWTALENYFRQTAKNATWLDANRKELGLKVHDKGEGYEIWRDTIGATPFTVMRGISKAAERAWLLMKGDWGQGLTTDSVAAAYEADPDALRASLQDRFNPEVLRQFVEPLINRTGRSVFYAPALGDGTVNMAMRERVIKAYEASDGDMVKFAENLYTLEGGTSDKAHFVGKTIATFQSFFNVLDSIHAEIGSQQQNGSPLPPRFLADARRTEEFPAEWLDYMTYGIHDMRQIVKAQTYQAAFGRNMEAMRGDLKTALDEQMQLANQYAELQKQFPTKSGRALRKAVTEAAKAQGLNLVALENAQQNAETLRRSARQFDAMLTMSSERPMEIQPWSEILSTLAGLAVSGPATAFSDSVAILEQPFRKFGFSTEALQQIAGTSKSLAVQVYGSLLQSIGQTTAAEGEYVRRLNELGHFDDDATLRLKDRLNAILDEHTAAANPLMKGAVHVSRVGRAVLATGIGRAQEGANVFPTAKPHSLFTWQSQMVTAAEIIGWWKRYEVLVDKAVRHFHANPADHADMDFKFRAKDLGHSEGRAWDYLRESMDRYGMNLEQVARDSVARRLADPKAPILTMDQYRALAAQSQNEVTLESGLTTRMPGLMTNPVLNMANPLLGWAVQKGYDAWRGFREPNGQKSMRGFSTGLMAYAAILPVTLAYALMRDKYDEEILGRKQNVLHLTTDNPYLAMLDNAARMGTFGLFGEIPNSILNVQTQRELSVDSRVFLVNTLLNIKNSLSTWAQQGHADYATVYRPLVQALGGNGYLQYVDSFNNIFGLDNVESRVAARINVNNYLRTTGRELGMDVRSSRGMQSMPTPIKPYIGQMVIAALANDHGEFQEAYRAALREARDQRIDDPEGYVKRSFASYNPLRSVFQTPPDEAGYQKILRSLDDNGREAVATAIRLFNGYAEQIGAREFTGSNKRAKAGSTLTLADIRRRAGYY